MPTMQETHLEYQRTMRPTPTNKGAKMMNKPQDFRGKDLSGNMQDALIRHIGKLTAQVPIEQMS